MYLSAEVPLRRGAAPKNAAAQCEVCHTRSALEKRTRAQCMHILLTRNGNAKIVVCKEKGLLGANRVNINELCPQALQKHRSHWKKAHSSRHLAESASPSSKLLALAFVPVGVARKLDPSQADDCSLLVSLGCHYGVHPFGPGPNIGYDCLFILVANQTLWFLC